MSKETSKWLNTMTLIGQTLKRGMAWHYRAEQQDDGESNHYEGFIPVEDVQRRLFNFKVVERRTAVELPVGDVITMASLKDEDLTPQEKKVLVGTRKLEWVARNVKAMCTDDDNTELGAFKQGYRGHDYVEWLLNNIGHIIGDDLNITSAGLLRNRAQAWVEISVPDSVTTPEGVIFRPNLLGFTSCDGTLATGYKKSFQNTVCDNTMHAAIGGAGEVIKFRHSKNSMDKLQVVKDALAIVHTAGDDFAAEVKRLCETTVSNKQWDALVDQLVPIPTGDDASKRGVTVAENKREKLQNLWTFDSRVSPWTGTGWGALQAFNTYKHHMSTVKGDQHRGTRNMDDAISGLTAKGDETVLKALELVLSN